VGVYLEVERVGGVAGEAAERWKPESFRKLMAMS
jgi:hypothetical protein